MRDDYENYEDDAERVRTYHCDGYCGAGDCETCHPGGAARIAWDAAYDTWMSEVDQPILTALVKVKALLAEVEAMIETGRDNEFAVSCEVRAEVEARVDELGDIIDSVTKEDR